MLCFTRQFLERIRSFAPKEVFISKTLLIDVNVDREPIVGAFLLHLDTKDKPKHDQLFRSITEHAFVV